MANKPFIPGSPPSLSPGLLNMYQSLSIDNQKVFIKVFRYLWGVLLPVRSFRGAAGPLRSFWILDIALRSYSLTPSYFSVLTFIYQVSRHGKLFVCSADVYNNVNLLPDLDPRTKQNYISYLFRKGYVVRSWSNPDEPYLQKSFRSRPVFIKLSVKGVQLIESIEKDIYKRLLNTSLNDVINGK